MGYRFGNPLGWLFGKLKEKLFRIGAYGPGERREVELLFIKIPAGLVKDGGEPSPIFHYGDPCFYLILAPAAQRKVALDVLEDRHVRVQGVPLGNECGVR